MSRMEKIILFSTVKHINKISLILFVGKESPLLILSVDTVKGTNILLSRLFFKKIRGFYLNRAFHFHIRSIESGWVFGKIVLGGGSIDFRMSAVLGDDLTKFLLAVLSFYPDIETVGEWLNAGSYHCEDFPCEEISINEEGTLVEWVIVRDESRDGCLHIVITAERYDEEGNETPVCLRGEVLYKDFAAEIISAIDNWLREHGLMRYFREWGRPFPLVEFLVAKALLTKKSPWNRFGDELAPLSEAF